MNFGQPPSRYAQREFLDSIVACRQLVPIDEQEYFSRRNGDTFVAVDEWVIRAKMEVVCRRFLRQPKVKINPAESGLWHGDGRLQQSTVT